MLMPWITWAWNTVALVLISRLRILVNSSFYNPYLFTHLVLKLLVDLDVCLFLGLQPCYCSCLQWKPLRPCCLAKSIFICAVALCGNWFYLVYTSVNDFLLHVASGTSHLLIQKYIFIYLIKSLLFFFWVILKKGNDSVYVYTNSWNLIVTST